MLKPNALQKGDKIAIVSLSWGGLGDDNLIHKYYIANIILQKIDLKTILVLKLLLCLML